MDLDGDLAHIEIGGDLLVQTPGDGERHHFTLARGERSVALPQPRHQIRLRALRAVARDPAYDRIKQILIAKWFAEKFDGAFLHCPHRHRYIPVAGDENDRKMDVRNA